MTIFTFLTPKTTCDKLIRVCVKDNIAVKGMPLTCASRTLLSFVSPYDADCISLLRQHDRFAIMGKTNMDEFGMGSFTRHSVHGACQHPVLRGSTPGGSSGGSAVAVFSDLADVGIGSDTGGSIRLPAAFCNLIGFKPAYGSISRHGLVSYSPSMDCVGLLAKKDKVNLLYDMYLVMSSQAPSNDMTFVGDVQDRQRRPKSVLLLSKAKKYCDPSIWNDTLELANQLASKLQLPLLSMDWDRFQECIAAYYCIASIEALSCLQRYPLMSTGQMTFSKDNFKPRHSEFGPEVEGRLRMAKLLTELSLDVYSRADRLRQSIDTDLRDMSQDSIIVLPTAPATPPTLNHDHPVMDEYDYDIFTAPFSLAGLPVWSVPCGTVKWAGLQLSFTNPHFIYHHILSEQV